VVQAARTHPELDRADPRVPGSLAVAVTDVDPRRRALSVGGAAERIRLRAHQRLDEALHHRSQQIAARLLRTRIKIEGPLFRR
jgi:hypothetical protein